MSEVVFEVPRLLHQSPERSLSVRAPRVQQYAEPLRSTVGVNPFADGARRIAAAHGKRLDQEVRKGMQQHVRAAGERALAFAVFHPALMSAREGVETLLDDWPTEPALHCL